MDFAKNIRKIVTKMMDRYNENTTQYITEEVEKVRE